MNVRLNGRPHRVESASTVQDVIRALGLDPRSVIVEHNGEPVERRRFADLEVREGDRLELVRAVAGG